MAYLGFLALGGRCIVNDCRTIQRVADGYGPPGIVCRECDPCCGDLSAGLGYPNGYNPTDTPWFDGTQDSVDFAGLLIENIEGLSPGPYAAPVTETSGIGAVIGQGRQTAPTVIVTALLLAASCCAQEFGLAWLRRALKGQCGTTSGCAGEDLLFLSCEPESPDLDCLNPEPVNDYAAAVLADAPAIYYKLDDADPAFALIDSSGHGLNLDAGGLSPNNVTSSPLFNSSVASMSTYGGNFLDGLFGPFDPVPYPLITGSVFTLEGWAQVSGNDILSIFESFTLTDSSSCAILLNFPTPGDIRGRIIRASGAPSATVDVSAGVNDGLPHYYAMRCDGSTMELFMDGVSIGSTAVGAGAMATDSVVSGSDAAGPGLHFVDDLALYSTDIGAAGIAAHYAASLTPIQPGASFDFEAWLAPYYRTLKGVALIDGPRVIERQARACPGCNQCPIYRVQFTLAAAKPCVFSDPITITDTESFLCGELGTDCIEWSNAADCADDDECLVAPDCGADPDCPSTVEPPTVPPIQNPCVDECITAITCQVCADIPAGTFPGEGTLIVTIFSGSEPLRNINLKVWPNPLDLDPEFLSDCDACSELNISYLAADSTLVIDGTTGTAVIECPGGSTIRANPFIASGTGSAAFTYPSLDGCVGRYTVCVRANGSAAIDSWVSIVAVPREC